MTDLQTKVRRAAKQALHRWMHSEVDGNPMDEIADAVLTVTLQEVLKYRPQHDEDCGVHWIFAERECTCGLSALQSFGQAPREQQEKDHGASLLPVHPLASPTATEALPTRLDLEFCPRCSSGPRQKADVVECPDCGYHWSGPRLRDLIEGDDDAASRG